MRLRDKIEKFKKNNEEAVIEAQREKLKYILGLLFEFSPHYLDSMGGYAKGQYDSNHKLLIDSISAPNGPLFSEAMSKALNLMEQNKADSINKIGEIVSVMNMTPHAIDVETGIGWEFTDGYFTYRTVRNFLLDTGIGDYIP